MVLEDLVGQDTRLYAKSEWAPASALWPALSFSQRGVANTFGGIYSRGRDFVITIGTGNPRDTLDPAHRQRLMSIVDVAPNIVVATGDLVEPETWRRAQQTHPDRWKLSMPIVRCWTFSDFPEAKTSMTETYRRFSNPTTRGKPIPVEGSDRATLLGLRLSAVEIPSYVERRLHPIPEDQLLNRDITRLVNNILGSVGRAGTERTGTYPERSSLNFSDLFKLLNELWRSQRGRCGLCCEPIVPGEENALLRMSADRIESANKGYHSDNVHVTHVGCNLAKSSASLEVWAEFLDVVRGTRD
ncbi:hypothetical protein [Bradyrhizobium diazoefficiens]|uniref:Uncharacterized protein n=1 Tax=Bradyrhizobium diazoefficiens TaxID=1355477 RepID=A0A809Z1L2_9BRAD|nr:hypothetical protein [Bradyrhizobium diazoefficiens]QLD45916.1 hypothetical protein HUW42_35185 [Bradyrhizobium diazoefficiens]WLA72250.1 hypothetical protein QIH77_36010 [Bradyrhizobium diazoefficiens]BBZ92733.1 hypothetical protein F07S3_25660 [Bradyrhizobium diazoefficiens]BCA10484.1 hypothetical protein BDHF08_23310 [Bradyrhizobium diazoefficiens]BCE19806.1 hypothetical protein XF1B_24870 [Bradyrhizobium diazoefficiens]